MTKYYDSIYTREHKGVHPDGEKFVRKHAVDTYGASVFDSQVRSVGYLQKASMVCLINEIKSVISGDPHYNGECSIKDNGVSYGLVLPFSDKYESNLMNGFTEKEIGFNLDRYGNTSEIRGYDDIVAIGKFYDALLKGMRSAGCGARVSFHLLKAKGGRKYVIGSIIVSLW